MILFNSQKESVIRLSNLHFFLLFSYVIGVVLWYQLSNPFLFLILPITPILFLQKNNRTKTISLLLLLLLIGYLRASFTNVAAVGKLNETAIVSSLPRDYGYYKKAMLFLNHDKESLYIDAYFDKNADLALFDNLKITGEILEPNNYKNINFLPAFIKKYEAETRILKVRSFQILSSNSFIKRVYKLRERMKLTILQYAGKSKNFLLELLFGERLLGSKERRLFANTGVAHLLSISGLHFAITVFFAFILVYLFQYFYPPIAYITPRHYLVVIFSLPLVLFYAFISGLSIPAFRAFLAFLMVATFFLLRIAPKSLPLLSVIALTFLVFEPTLIFNKSFQLSFLSVFVLLIFYKKTLKLDFFSKGKNKKILSYLFGIVLTSVLISLFIFPVTQNMAPQSLLISIISNPVAIPLVTFIVLPFSFVALTFSLVSKKLFFLLLTIPEFGWHILYNYLKLIEPVANISKFNIHFSFWGGILYLITLSSFFLKGRVKFICVTFFAILTLLSFQKRFEMPFLTFLDVGQGDAALFRTKSGKLIFIDTGGNIYDYNLYNRAYKPFLSLLAQNSIEAVILSHYHPDHYKALEELLNFYNIKNVYAPMSETASPILDLWKNHDFQLHLIASKKAISIDELSLTLLPQRDFKRENDRSLWCVVKKDKKLFLFTGDTEKKAIDKILKKEFNEKCFLIKVPHHGAKSSFFEELYLKTNPKVAVITVGRRNPFRLPSEEVLRYLMKRGLSVYRTDKNGQIFVFLDKEKPNIKSFE